MKYEYGVEYQTNGKKPDLPHDVIVQIDGSKYGEWLPPRKVGSNMWGVTNKFRIVDERYKPKPESAPEQSWYERGELPPVGTECEYSIGELPHKTCTFVGINSRGSVVIEDCHGEYKSYHAHQIKLHPMRSEREKFIDAATNIMMKNCDSYGKAAEALFDAGFRAPENKQ